MRILLVSIALLSILGVLYGFLGALDRSADTVGMARPAFALLILLGALAARHRMLRLFLGAFGLISLASVVVFFLPQPAGSDLRLYVKNIYFGNADVQALKDDIEAADVDVVVLQELSGRNAQLSEQLRATFPYQHICQFSWRFGMAVLSRHPLTQTGKCSSRRALAAAQIVKDDRNVWIVSTHIPWPYPFENEAAEVAAETLLQELDGTIVVAGDFNVYPWSGRLQRIRALTKTKMTGPVRPTLTLYDYIPMPIDYVLAPNGGSLERRPLFGSDHRGLVADINF